VVCSSLNVDKDLKRTDQIDRTRKLPHLISLENISVNFNLIYGDTTVYLTEDDKISSPLEEASFSEFMFRRGRWVHWLQRTEC
jgi:hypothetical protein